MINVFMTRFALLVILLIQSGFVFAQIANNGMNFFNYSYDKSLIKMNKVETVTIEMSLSNGKSSGKLVFQFNKDGLLIKESIFNSNGNPEQEFYFVTNSHNDLICRISKSYEFNKTDTVKYFKSYTGNKLVKDSSDDLPVSYCYEYNSSGNLIKTEITSNFFPGNTIKRIILNKFDSLSRLINRVETLFQNESNLQGTVISAREFIYDSKGRIKKEIEKMNIRYFWSDNPGAVEYDYDANGNLIQILRENAASYFYTYDEKGLITSGKMEMKLKDNEFNENVTTINTLDKFIYTFIQ